MVENIGNGLEKVGGITRGPRGKHCRTKGTQTYPTAAGHDWKWARHKAGP